MSAKSLVSPVESATYSVAEAAARAGVSKRTVWRWLDARRVPGVVRVGRVVRVNKRLFEQWLEGASK